MEQVNGCNHFNKETKNQLRCERATLKRKSSFLLPFLLFIIIFISDDTLTFGTNANKLFIYFKYLIYFLLMLWLLNRFGIRTIVPMSTIYLFAIIIAIFSTALVNFDFRGGYGYQIMTVTLAFLIAHFINHKQFLEIFSKYLFVLCIISILVFIVANSFSGLLEYFPVHENTAGVQFANLYISGVFIDVGAIRNTGIFREPGVFMIYLLVCILFELYYSTKPNMKHIALYSIAIITTFSTAAILILFFVIAGYILTQKGKGIVKYKAITMVFAFILISIFIFYPNVSFKIFSKLDMDSATM